MELSNRWWNTCCWSRYYICSATCVRAVYRWPARIEETGPFRNVKTCQKQSLKHNVITDMHRIEIILALGHRQQPIHLSTWVYTFHSICMFLCLIARKYSFNQDLHFANHNPVGWSLFWRISVGLAGTWLRILPCCYVVQIPWIRAQRDNCCFYFLQVRRGLLPSSILC